MAIIIVSDRPSFQGMDIRLNITCFMRISWQENNDKIWREAEKSSYSII